MDMGHLDEAGCWEGLEDPPVFKFVGMYFIAGNFNESTNLRSLLENCLSQPNCIKYVRICQAILSTHHTSLHLCFFLAAQGHLSFMLTC